MLNILRMENYRLIKSRYPKIILIAIIAIAIGLLFFTDILLPNVDERLQEVAEAQAQQQSSAENASAETDAESRTGSFSVDVNYEMALADEDLRPVEVNSRLEDFFNFIKPTSTPIFFLIGIFVALFVSENYKTGFAKNFVGNFTNRGSIIVAQYLSAVLFMLGTLFVTFITFMVFKSVIAPDGLPFGSIVEFLPALGSLLLSYAAFIALVLHIYYLTNSQALTLIFTVLYGIDAFTQILQVIELAIDNFFKRDVALADKLLSIRMNDLAFLGNRTEMITLVIYAFIIICVSLGLSSIKFQRADIN